MLLNAQGKVFVAKRIDTDVEAWQMPQGGIDAGETPRNAAFREMEEEIGSKNAIIIDQNDDWLFYDLPPHLIGKVWNGKYRGQKMKWFVFKFQGQDSEINIATEHPEFCEWQWIDMKELVNSIIDFKRPLYSKLVQRFGHLAG